MARMVARLGFANSSDRLVHNDRRRERDQLSRAARPHDFFFGSCRSQRCEQIASIMHTTNKQMSLGRRPLSRNHATQASK
jgi:hypothetical protein